MTILKQCRLRGANDSIIELHLFQHPWGCEVTVSGGSVDNLRDALKLLNILSEFIGMARLNGFAGDRASAEDDDTARRDWEREIYKRTDEENKREFEGKEGER